MLSSNPSMDTTYGPINLDFCRGTISNDVHICLSNEAMSHQQCSPLDGSFINHTAAESDRDKIQLPREAQQQWVITVSILIFLCLCLPLIFSFIIATQLHIILIYVCYFFVTASARGGSRRRRM